MASAQRIRSLPKPPTDLPAYEPPAPSSSSPKPPVDSTSTVAFTPPKPSPRYVENPPVLLSAAQQLYASSFANCEPPIPTLPPPSFESPRRNGPEQPSFYKNQVSSYLQHSTLGARSPDSTFPSTSSSTNTRFISSPSIQTPGHSFSDGGQRTMPTARDLRLRLNSATYARGRAELDRHNLPPITTETSSHANFSLVPTYLLPQETRNLFPLTYVDADKPRELRTVTTTVKPPPSYEASYHSITSNVLEGPPHASASLAPSLSLLTSERAHPLPIIVSPSPPPLNVLQQSKQQSFAVPFHPQSYIQPTISPHSPQNASSASSSSNPAEPNKKRTSRFMNGIKTSLASSLGQLAVRSSVHSAQSLLSGSSIEEEREDTEDGGSSCEMSLLDFLKLDATGSASASGGSGGFNNGGGGGGSEAQSTVIAPVPRSGARYTQNPSATLSVATSMPSMASGDAQYTSHNVSNTMNQENIQAIGYTYTRQTHLPAGAQQPPVYKPPLPGRNPY